MIAFDLETPRGKYPGAEVFLAGFYRQENPGDPRQPGWRVMHQGEILGTPTVNLWSPPVFPAPGCVWLKITPEFAGWLESLERAGIVERTGRVEPAGLVARYAAECRVLVLGLLRPLP